PRSQARPASPRERSSGASPTTSGWMHRRCRRPWYPTPSPVWVSPRLLGLAIDWTMFDTTLPSGQRIRYQVLRIAVPRKGRALSLLQLAYDRDDLSPNKSQNHIEQEALSAVARALPMGVRPV